jgi:DNA polymerase V
MFRSEYQYKKAGIMLSEISPVTHQQGDLLQPVLADNHKLMEALDTLNARYGRGSVNVSTQGGRSGWQMKQERRSPNYTTSWTDVPLV